MQNSIIKLQKYLGRAVYRLSSENIELCDEKQRFFGLFLISFIYASVKK